MIFEILYNRISKRKKMMYYIFDSLGNKQIMVNDMERETEVLIQFINNRQNVYKANKAEFVSLFCKQAVYHKDRSCSIFNKYDQFISYLEHLVNGTDEEDSTSSSEDETTDEDSTSSEYESDDEENTTAIVPT
jgi:hypothetical protein